MRIGIIAVLFSVYTTTSANWWAFRGPAQTPVVKDCEWLDFIAIGPCLETPHKKFKYGKLRKREKSEAQNGGKECDGSALEIYPCDQNEYLAHLFHRTVVAVLSGGGSTSRRTLNRNAPKKCVSDITDDQGEPLAAGRSCPKGARKTRRVHDSMVEMKRRYRRQAPTAPPTPPPILSKKARDVLFLLDESGSVGKTNFKKIIRMAKALTNSFCRGIDVGISKTQVGVMSFNREQTPQINFSKFSDKALLIDAMDTKIKYKGYPSAGATCLVEALKFTRSKMMTPARGARINVPGTERIVILITDGCANCVNNNLLKANLNAMGNLFTTDGVPIITFLIADKPSYCFDIMKGLSDGSQCYQQFGTKNWAAFDAFTQTIESSPCMDAWMIGPSC